MQVVKLTFFSALTGFLDIVYRKGTRKNTGCLEIEKTYKFGLVPSETFLSADSTLLAVLGYYHLFHHHVFGKQSSSSSTAGQNFAK
jgi:hypothetical protein